MAMQAALAGMSAAAGDRERLQQALLDAQRALKTTKAGALPPNTVATLGVALNAYLHDATLTVQLLKCLVGVCDLLHNPAPIMRLEGGLRATLAALQGPCGQDNCNIAACGLQLLATLCGTSPVTAQGLIQEKDVARLLLGLLQQHLQDKHVAGAACDVLMLASKYSKGAKRLADEPLVPTLQAVLQTHAKDARAAGAALKTLKNVAKHEACRVALVETGAVQVLLTAAATYANLPDQGKQVKRACRAVWLLCAQALPPMPAPVAGVPLPHRDSKHLTLPPATEANQPQRLQELFPELQGAAGAGMTSAPANAAGVPCSVVVDSMASCGLEDSSIKLPTRMLQPTVTMAARPPTAAELTALAKLPGSATPEPFHAWGAAATTRMMLHDLQRITAPHGVVNQLVYDSGAGSKRGRRTGAASALVSSSESAIHTGCCPSINAASCTSDSAMACRPTAAQEGTACQSAGGNRSTADVSHSSDPALLVGSESGQLSAERLPAAESSIQKESGTIKRIIPCDPARSSSRALQANCAPASAPPGQLCFESRFECGNLRAAYLVKGNEYDLFLAPDINDRSKGSNMVQWFYFAVTHASPGTSYKLNLVNFCKKDSMYNSGKQPLMCAGISNGCLDPAPLQCSEAAAGSHNNCSTHSVSECSTSAITSIAVWHRAGCDVCWHPSPYRGKPWTPITSNCISSNSTTSITSSSAVACENAASYNGGSNHAVLSPGAGGSNSSSTANAHDSNSSKGHSTKASSGRHKARKTKAAAAGSSGQKKVKDVSAVSEDLAPVGAGLYCCTFTITFPSSGTFFLANCYPYSCRDLQEYIAAVQLSAAQFAPPVPQLLQRSLLCHTLAGQRLELLTITDFSAPAEVLAAREYVVITARVHPGETCASWMMQGMLDFLLQPHHPVAQRLRGCFIFKVIPMLNPDGVTAGSYRCSLAGVDLNRTWDKAMPHQQPSIYHSRKLMEALAGCGRLALCLDLHGHSRQQDVFFYGCEPLAPKAAGPAAQQQQVAPVASTMAAAAKGAVAPLQEPGAAAAAQREEPAPAENLPAGSAAAEAGASLTAGPGKDAAVGGAITAAALSAHEAARLRVRMLPYLAARLHAGFSLAKCSFKTQKGKAGTARVVCARQLGVAGSYTVEASLGGCSATCSHFGIGDYLALGTALCEAISQLAEADDAVLLAEMAGSVQLPPAPDKVPGPGTKAAKAAAPARKQSVCTD